VRRTLAVAVAVTLGLILAGPGAQAQVVSGGGEATGNGNGGDVTVGVVVGESFPGSVPGGDSSTSRSSGVNLVTYGWRGPLPGVGCQAAGAEAPGVENVNDTYELVEYDRSVEPPTETVMQTSCFPPIDAPPVTPPPPAPPTMAEITALAQAEVRPPTVGVSPPGDGLTGLETWFWYEGQDQVSVETSIRGYAVTATMTPSHYFWETGQGLLGSPVPGSASAPAATYVYETKNDYRIFVQVVWDGTWTFEGWGASAAGSLATIRASGARDYTVNEVRSVLEG
jgi:hypothetical protein